MDSARSNEWLGTVWVDESVSVTTWGSPRDFRKLQKWMEIMGG
jgi:hypothetical protein